MQNNIIKIQEALSLPNQLFIDLRSPIEYSEAHIPGAINIPLLGNEERSLVGTIYKQNSPELAVEQGFEIIAPKLPSLCSQIKNYSKEKTVILYCWRGGMRSKSISNVLSIMGTEHFLLEGGYKSFRNYVNDFFSHPFDKELVILYGLTGVGKTEVLEQLKKDNFPVIDLEKLANHRGSVFGSIGLGRAPSQKQFEGLLFMECLKYKGFPRIAVECESQRIGYRIIPGTFFQAMQKGKKVLLFDSLENRVNRLMAIYLGTNHEELDIELQQALNVLRKHLGNTKVNELIKQLYAREYDKIIAKLLVDYYDPLYQYPDKETEEYDFCLENSNQAEVLNTLKMLLINKENLL